MTVLFLLTVFVLRVAGQVTEDDVNLECCDDLLGCFPDTGDFASFANPYCIREINPQFLFYSNATRNKPQYMTRYSDIPDEFSADRRTIFIVHGWRKNRYSRFLRDFKNALLDREDVNLIIVAWGNAAGSLDYYRAAATTRVMGSEVALRMLLLKAQQGINGTSIWCIGHSLGAHICGLAGSTTHVGRITGLDPARQQFEFKMETVRLDATDADFVDVIHTDTWGYTPFYYGILEPSGDADFYPNEGRKQPGCRTRRDIGYDDDEDGDDGDHDVSDENNFNSRRKRDIACSHGRSHELFLESIRNVDCFPIHRRCTKYYDLPESCYKCTDCGVMGYGADQGAPPTMGYGADQGVPPTGIFYLETESEEPFCPDSRMTSADVGPTSSSIWSALWTRK